MQSSPPGPDSLPPWPREGGQKQSPTLQSTPSPKAVITRRPSNQPRSPALTDTTLPIIDLTHSISGGSTGMRSKPNSSVGSPSPRKSRGASIDASKTSLPSPPATNSDTTGSVGKGSAAGQVLTPGQERRLGMIRRTDLLDRPKRGSSDGSPQKTESPTSSPIRRNESLSHASPSTSSSPPPSTFVRRPSTYKTSPPAPTPTPIPSQPKRRSLIPKLSHSRRTSSGDGAIGSPIEKGDTRRIQVRPGYGRQSSISSVPARDTALDLSNLSPKPFPSFSSPSLPQPRTPSPTKSLETGDEREEDALTPKKIDPPRSRERRTSAIQRRSWILDESPNFMGSIGRSDTTVLPGELDAERGFGDSGLDLSATEERRPSWEKEDDREKEMGPGEKVDMWRSTNGRNAGAGEGDSGGSGSSLRRRAGLPAEFMQQSDTQVYTQRNITNDHPESFSPTPSTRLEALRASVRGGGDRVAAMNKLLGSFTQSNGYSSSGIEGLPQPREHATTMGRANSLQSGYRYQNRGGSEMVGSSRLAALRASAGSAAGLRHSIGSLGGMEERVMDPDTARSRHSSLVPPPAGGRTGLDSEREESKLRRAALLRSFEADAQVTPERAATPTARDRFNVSEPRRVDGRPATSFSREVPNSAPGGFRSSTAMMGSVGSPRYGYETNNRYEHSRPLPDSPSDRYRPGTRMSHRPSGAAPSELGVASTYGGESIARSRTSGSETTPSSGGTPSRAVMARLLAGMRNATSEQSRQMMQACLLLVETTTRSPVPGVVDVQQGSQATVSHTDQVNSLLASALDLVARLKADCEIASPEEAQSIAITDCMELVRMLSEALKESDEQVGSLTTFLQASARVLQEGDRTVTRDSVNPARLSINTNGYSSDQGGMRASSSRDRLDSIRARPPPGATAHPAETGYGDREVRRMSSEIMRSATSLDWSSGNRRFSTQSRGPPLRIPNRTNGDYFTHSPVRQSPLKGDYDASPVRDGEMTTPGRRHTNGDSRGVLFHRLTNGALRTPPVPYTVEEDTFGESASYQPSHARKTSGPIPTTPRSFLQPAAVRTPTTALSAINATNETSPYEASRAGDTEYFDGESGTSTSWHSTTSNVRGGGVRQSLDGYGGGAAESATLGRLRGGQQVRLSLDGGLRARELMVDVPELSKRISAGGALKRVASYVRRG